MMILFDHGGGGDDGDGDNGDNYDNMVLMVTLWPILWLIMCWVGWYQETVVIVSSFFLSCQKSGWVTPSVNESVGNMLVPRK